MEDKSKGIRSQNELRRIEGGLTDQERMEGIVRLLSEALITYTKNKLEQQTINESHLFKPDEYEFMN